MIYHFFFWGVDIKRSKNTNWTIGAAIALIQTEPSVGIRVKSHPNTAPIMRQTIQIIRLFLKKKPMVVLPFGFLLNKQAMDRIIPTIVPLQNLTVVSNAEDSFTKPSIEKLTTEFCLAV